MKSESSSPLNNQKTEQLQKDFEWDDIVILDGKHKCFYRGKHGDEHHIVEPCPSGWPLIVPVSAVTPNN